MRRLTLTLVLFASVFLIGPAHAGSNPPSVDQLVRVARAEVVVPVEWDGTWATVDSNYICPTTLQSTSAGTDTICGGKDYSPNTQGSPITFTCSGTATATTIDITCTGSLVVFTDCTANYTIVIHGTRSGDTFHIVTTSNTTYSGTGAGCNLLPPSCSQFDSWGTRTGPAPAAYCSTPVRPSSWGQLKVLYR
jgi:hypothetical protein